MSSWSIILFWGEKTKSLNPDQYNPLSDLCLMKAKLFLNKCAWTWNYFGMITQAIHYTGILFFEQITQIPLIFIYSHHHFFFFFYSSFSSYFDTQLRKSTRAMPRGWLGAGSQPTKTSPAQNNFSLALLFFSCFLKLVLALYYQGYLRVNASLRISWVWVWVFCCFGGFFRKARRNRCVPILHILHLWLDLLFFVYVKCHGLTMLPSCYRDEGLLLRCFCIRKAHFCVLHAKQKTTLSLNRIYLVDDHLLQEIANEGGGNSWIPSVLFLPRFVFDVWRREKFPLYFWGR